MASNVPARRVDSIMNPGYSASPRHLYKLQRNVALQRLAIMHVGLIAASTSTVQSVHVRTRASYIRPKLYIRNLLRNRDVHQLHHIFVPHFTVGSTKLLREIVA